MIMSMVIFIFNVKQQNNMTVIGEINLISVNITVCQN